MVNTKQPHPDPVAPSSFCIFYRQQGNSPCILVPIVYTESALSAVQTDF